MDAVFELWSQVMPERAMACCFNLEYLLVGGRDARARRPAVLHVVRLDGRRLGRAQRQATAANCTSPVFGVGLAVQPLEGQERLTPGADHRARDRRRTPAGPGRFRGGCGVRKGGAADRGRGAVMSYCCDRARSITWGIEGGLPSIPHGVWLNRGEGEDERVPRRDVLQRDVGDGRRLHAALGGRRRLRRPARARPRGGGARTSPTATSRSSAPRIDYGVVVEGGRRRARRVRASTPRRPAASASASRRARRAGSRRMPRRSPRATATASSTSSTSSATTG